MARPPQEHDRKAAKITRGPQAGKVRRGTTVNAGVNYDDRKAEQSSQKSASAATHVADLAQEELALDFEENRKVRGGGAIRGVDADGRDVWFLAAPSGDSFKQFVADVKALPKHKRFFNAKMKKWVVATGSEADQLMDRYGLTQEKGSASLVVDKTSVGSDARVSASGSVDTDGVAILTVAVPVDLYLSSGMRDEIKTSGLVGRTWDENSKQWVFLDTPKTREFLSSYGIAPSSDGSVDGDALAAARDVALQRETMLAARQSAGRKRYGSNYTRYRTVDGGSAYYDDDSDDAYDAWKDGYIDSLPGVSNASWESHRRGKKYPGRWR